MVDVPTILAWLRRLKGAGHVRDDNVFVGWEDKGDGDDRGDGGHGLLAASSSAAPISDVVSGADVVSDAAPSEPLCSVSEP